MAKLLFSKGSYSALQKKIAANELFDDGALYLTTDEGGLYLGNGTKNLTRIQGSVLFFESLEAFTEKTKPPYSTDVIYFIANSDALVRWNGTEWIQLNATKAEFTGLNGRIDGVEGTVNDHTTDIANLKIITSQLRTDVDTKASNADLQAEITRAKGIEGDLDTKITNLNEKVEKNIDDIAKNTKAISDEVSARETAITDLTNSKLDKATYDAKIKLLDATDAANTKAIEAVQTAVENAQAAADNAAAAATQASTAAANAQTTADAAQAAVETEVTRATGAEETLQTNITTETKRATAAEDALKSSINTKLSTAGGTMSGELKMGTNKITGLGAPTVTTDAATKKYVDDEVAKVTGNATDLEKRVTAVEGKASENATAISSHETSIDTLTTTTTNHGTRLTTAETTIKSHTTAINGKLDTATFTTEKAALVEDIAAAQKAADDARAGVNTANGEINTLKETSATKAELNTATSTLLGATGDAATAATIYGAKKAAANAQTTADAAKNQANTNKTAISDLTENLDIFKTEVKTGYVKIDGSNAMTGNLSMGGKQITNLAYSTVETDAATVGYVNNALQTADAMTFKGVLGTNPLTLPTGKVNKGDTYKVGVSGTYAGIVAKVGDLIIYNGADADTAVAANWVHVTSGYEDDYLQKLKYDTTNKVFYLTDGVHTENSNNQGTFKVVSNNQNLEISISADGVISADLVWGTF